MHYCGQLAKRMHNSHITGKNVFEGRRLLGAESSARQARLVCPFQPSGCDSRRCGSAGIFKRRHVSLELTLSRSPRTSLVALSHLSLNPTLQ